MAEKTVIAERKDGTSSLADLASTLGIDVMPLAELAKQMSALDIARAWAAGEIEFGRRSYVVTGPAGTAGSTLVIEDGWDWSGPKKPSHKNYRDLSAEVPPETEKCGIYQKFPGDRAGEPSYLKLVNIPRAEALPLIALSVRLTDKGLAAVGAA